MSASAKATLHPPSDLQLTHDSEMATAEKNTADDHGRGGRESYRCSIVLEHPEMWVGLCLPSEFTKRFPDEVIDSITVQTKTGPPFMLVGIHEGMGNSIFMVGWEEFTNYYGVEDRYTLRIKYNGDALFKVEIYNEKGTEIDYNLHEVHKKEAVGKARLRNGCGGWLVEDVSDESDEPDEADDDGEDSWVEEITPSQFRVSQVRKRKAAGDGPRAYKRIARRASLSAKMELSSRTTSGIKINDHPKWKKPSLYFQMRACREEKTRLSAKERDRQPYGQFLLRFPASLDNVFSLYIPRRMSAFTAKIETRPWKVVRNHWGCEVTIKLHKRQKGRADFTCGVRQLLKSNQFEPGQWLKFEVVDDGQGFMRVDVDLPPQ